VKSLSTCSFKYSKEFVDSSKPKIEKMKRNFLIVATIVSGMAMTACTSAVEEVVEDKVEEVVEDKVEDIVEDKTSDIMDGATDFVDDAMDGAKDAVDGAMDDAKDKMEETLKEYM
jgi:hypothetical protein